MALKLLLAAAAGAFAQGGEIEPASEAGTPAHAVAAQNGRTVYPAAFFADFQPGNAYEMLQRLPGFTFDGGDSDVRGFAGAGGNVLIDGVRPSSKSVTLQDALRRIPAAAVTRIELVRSGDPTIDLQGRPLVANVVRRAGAGGSVIVTGMAKRYGDGWIAPRLSVEATHQLGPALLEGALRAEDDLDTDSGAGRRVTVRPSGAVVRDNPLFTRERERALGGNLTATLKRPADTLRLNGGAETGVERTLSLIGPQRSAGREETRKGEFGGDYERTLGRTLSAKLVGLQTFARARANETNSDPGGSSTSFTRQDNGESIVRGSATWRPMSVLSIEAGGEGAFNWLESDVALTENGRPIPLPNDNVRIEERRAEGFATTSWTATPRLAVEGSLRMETSKLTQSGDSRLTRTFFFAKPRLNLSYAPGSASNLRLRIERTVGQLDFSDFAASADLNLGVVNAGNARLAPERAWVAETAIERRFWGEGAAVLTLKHEWVSQVVDRLPLGGGLDGPGNIGDGTRDEARLTVAVPLDRLGIAGGRLAGEGMTRRTRVTDPLTGARRRISNWNPLGGNMTFTQDLAALHSTWTVSADFGGEWTSFRINEVRRDRWEPMLTASWEWRPRAGLAIRLEAENFTGRSFMRRRTLYDGPRNLFPIAAYERRDAKLDPFFTLRVRNAF